MKKKGFYTELAYLFGLVILAAGTALMERANFGMSMVVAPAYLLHLKLSRALPFFSFGMAEYLFQGLLLLVMVALLRSFRITYLFSFATAVAWVASVAFAFWANKVFVFKSPGWNRKVLSRELPGFVSARLLSLVFDWAFVLLTVKLAGMNDLVAKLISNIVVIVLNYFASKFWIFRKR